MSLTINDEEVISNLIIDNRDRKYGTPFNFVGPKNQQFLNFTRIKRIALTQINMSAMPYSINDYNNKFTITDGTNSYQVVLAKGYITVEAPPITSSYKVVLENAMNANPYGWIFTVLIDAYTGDLTWTSSVPTRVSVASEQILDCLGIKVSNILSTSYRGAIYNGTYTNVLYICSQALCSETVRDVHTNIGINHVLGVLNISDQILTKEYYHVRKEWYQLKIFDFEESRPLPNDIDIYFVDAYGNPIIDELGYLSNRITLEFKIVSTRNPQDAIVLREKNKQY